MTTRISMFLLVMVCSFEVVDAADITKCGLLTSPPVNQAYTCLEIPGAWGVISKLSDNSLGLVFQTPLPAGNLDHAAVKIVFGRSLDLGATWKLQTIASTKPDNGELFVSNSNGISEVYTYRNIALGSFENGRVVASFSLMKYLYINGLMIKGAYGWNSTNLGVYYLNSKDFGSTWSQLNKLDVSPFEYASPHMQIINKGYGLGMMSIYGTVHGFEYEGQLNIRKKDRSAVAILRTSDYGLNWENFSVITSKTSHLPFEETSLVQIGDKALAFVRFGPEGNQSYGTTRLYSSVDDGYSWSYMQQLTEDGGIPGSGLAIGNEIVLFVYGNRFEPFGTWGKLSFDRGESWSKSVEIFDGCPVNEHSGYPNVVVLDNIIIGTCYNIPAESSLKAKWYGSKQYVFKLGLVDLIRKINQAH